MFQLKEEVKQASVRNNSTDIIMKQAFLFGMGTAVLSLGLAIGGYISGTKVAEHKNVVNSNFTLPVFASASCESDGVSIATGAFGSNVEAMYYLDSQNARLSAAVISRDAPSFQKSFSRNLKNDLVEAAQQFNVAVPTTPKFLMVTGDSDVRNVGTVGNLSKSLVYIAEINSGIVLVYALPGANERDLLVQDGKIVFWTCARLNEGAQNIPVGAPQPADGAGANGAENDPQRINTGFFRTR